MILRELDRSDLETILAIRNHDNIRQCMFNTDIITLEQHKKWYQKYIMDENKVTLIGIDGNNEIIGVINLNFPTKDKKIIDWGFYVKPDSPKGTGTVLLSKGLEKLFNEYYAERIFGQVISFNTKSINIHKKLGFKLEGILRSHYQRDNQFFDIYEFGLLKTEYKLSDGIIYEN